MDKEDKERIFGDYWAIMPERVDDIRRCFLAADEPEAEAIWDDDTLVYADTAVIPLYGIISQKAGWWGTSTEGFIRQVANAVDDASIKSIVIDANSPGGSVYGVHEASSALRELRGRKRITAIVNPLMASAAYWIGSAADEIVIEPSGEAGSIGVLAVHADYSKALETEGIRITLIHSGKFKTEGNPYEPLTAAARTAIQARNDEYYEMFTRDVAVNRGVSIDVVKEGFGQGRVVGGHTAVQNKMADRIDTMKGLLAPARAKARIGLLRKTQQINKLRAQVAR